MPVVVAVTIASIGTAMRSFCAADWKQPKRVKYDRAVARKRGPTLMGTSVGERRAKGGTDASQPRRTDLVAGQTEMLARQTS